MQARAERNARQCDQLQHTGNFVGGEREVAAVFGVVQIL